MLSLAVDHRRESDSAVLCDIIGRSDRMRRVFDLVQRVADSDSTIIINGETGTGKGLLARAIHQLSSRRDKPFVTINCGTIPENLLESELFGHVRGAFTGAAVSKPGKFEIANGGTVFLDEIGDMSPDLQVKLLRVLEEREFEPVGGNRTVKVDVRILAATHRDLEEAVQKGTFREDLFYRLFVIPVTLPALRERRSDIPLLVEHFRAQYCSEKHRCVTGIQPAALESLVRYNWPGNVRELRNMMERLVVLKGSGELDMADLPEKLRGHDAAPLLDPPAGVELTDEGINLTTAVTEFEKALIRQSLEISGGVKNKAAKLLQLNRTTLVEKIKRLQLE
jgi:transcriptional regulator with PAS, ATPase and Fis domain